MDETLYASGLLFRQAYQMVRVRVERILSEHDLTPSYWSILGATQAAPEGIRLAKVAMQMGVKAPLVTMLVNDLITKDLINRVPHHTDGRAKLLTLTSAGKKLVNTLNIELDKEVSKLLEGATKAEIASFRKVLQVITANAQ